MNTLVRGTNFTAHDRWFLSVIYGLTHLVVNLSCYAALFKLLFFVDTTLPIYFVLLIFNWLVFGSQVVIGYFFDLIIPEKKYHSYLSISGCTLILISLGLINYFLLPALILCALGNALFHIAGSVDALSSGDGETKRYGIFSAYGVLGIMSGSYLGYSTAYSVLFSALLIGVCLLFHLQYCRFGQTPEVMPTPKIFIQRRSMPWYRTLILVLFIFFTTTYATVLFTINQNQVSAFVLWLVPVGIVIGRLLSGYLCDLYGAQKTGIFSLILACFLLGFGHNMVLTSFLGIAYLNMHTSLALGFISYLFPRNPGFSIGLTKFPMLLGATLPLFITIPNILVSWMTMLLCLAAASALIIIFYPGDIDQNEDTHL